MNRWDGKKNRENSNLYGGADTLQHIWTWGTIDLNAVCTHPCSQLKMALIKCHLSNGHVARYDPGASLHPRLSPYMEEAGVNTLKILPFAISCS